MKKRFLITTSLEQDIKTNTPLLLLGEWCRPIPKRDKFKKLDFKVLPYHWDDRSKLHKDYLYLDKFYEKLLLEITFKLNQIHGTSYDIRYWRIVIGPWLGFFLQIIFDRWSSIQSAINKFELCGTYIQSFEKDLLIPKSMKHFNELCRSEKWNHFIYSYIIKNYTKLNYVNKAATTKDVEEKTHFKYSSNYKYKEIITNYINLVAKFFQKKDDIFFINTYLSKKDNILLSLKFFQIPMFYSNYTNNYLDNTNFKIEYKKRQWKLEDDESNDFESFAKAIIPMQFPRVYLEGYNFMNKRVSLSQWPSKPKAIFTSSSFMVNDFFKLYAAKKVYEKKPLIIGQHGGGIGTHLFAFYEKHQLDICDLYLSWGWTDSLRPKIKSVGILKNKKPLKVNHQSQNKITLLAAKLSINSYHIHSAPISTQSLNYFNDQCVFINTLDIKIKNALTVRLKQMENGQEPSPQRWKIEFPDINFDNGLSNINKLLKESRLCISTYNATTFLETISMNVPTVMFWNPNHWELREPAKSYFNNLKKVGVFHETPESAARHVNIIWQDVGAWWNSEIVKDAIKVFRENYCKQPNNLVNEVYYQIKKVLN